MRCDNHIGVVNPSIVSRIREIDMRHRPLSHSTVVDILRSKKMAERIFPVGEIDRFVITERCPLCGERGDDII